MGLEDFPKYVRYDFFMALLGLLMFYFSFSNNKIYNSFFFHWLLIILGIIFFIYGIYQMKDNYMNEQKLEQLRREAEIMELHHKVRSNTEKLKIVK